MVGFSAGYNTRADFGAGSTLDLGTRGWATDKAYESTTLPKTNILLACESISIEFLVLVV